MLKASQIIVDPGNAIIKKKPALYFEQKILGHLKNQKSITYLGFDIDSSDDWLGSHTKLVLECNRHGVYTTCSFNNLLKGRGCKKCSLELQVINQSMTYSEFIDRCNKIHNGLYNYEKSIYVNAKTKLDILCNSCKTIFSMTPTKHLIGQGCRKCCKFGGYDHTKPGYFYIQKLSYNDEVYYKFGITYDIKKRIRQQKSGSLFNHTLIYSNYFENGILALKLESLIKNKISCGIVSKNYLPDGYTETFSTEHLDTVMEIVNNFE